MRATELYFSTDVLADILRRLPPSSRRRARLVSRCWRYVVDKRTTEMQSRAVPLVWNDGVAYVVRDLSSESLCRTGLAAAGSRDSYLVGSCNGLLCICDNEERTGGSLTVANPATGETLPVPPLPFAGLFVGQHYQRQRWDEAYNFAYHPTTGKYKVVHVPCSYDRICDFETVHVLTLGEAAWREVPAPVGGARCDVDAGVISLDGATHWVKVGGATRIVSFDLETERFAPAATALPPLPDKFFASMDMALPRYKRSTYHLTEVHGRLGFVFLPDVWVLKQGRWSLRYRVEGCIPRPHFVYGDHVLTSRRYMPGLYRNRPKSTPPSGWRIGNGVVRIGDHETLVANTTGRTFAYVETTEPLSVYATN